MKNNQNQSVLVVGASGATGRLLTDQLLKMGQNVKAIVRTPERLPDFLKDRKGLTVIKASLLDLTDEQLVEHTEGCYAIASCLGHNLTFKGIYGHPRRLVTEATHRLCRAAMRHDRSRPLQFVLMNTSGNRNRDLEETISFAQRVVVGLIRLLLPPHADNEAAADYLRTQIGQNHLEVEWVALRPDGLIDQPEVSAYELHPSPTRSAIFNAGKTSRINVGHFMAKLITDDISWQEWKGRMPVIYNV